MTCKAARLRSPALALALAAVALLGATLGPEAHAISFTYAPAAGLTGLEPAALTELANQVNSSFHPGMEDPFLKSMADASRSPSSSQGTDGTVRGSIFSFSTSASAALATQSSFGAFQVRRNQLPGVGAAVQPAVTLGINARKFNKYATFGLDPEKVDYFVTFMKLDFPNIGGHGSLKSTNFALMGRYWLRDSRAPNWFFRFDGLSVSTGIQHSSMDLAFKSNLDFSASANAGPTTVTMDWKPTADFGVETSTTTIPVDFRTGITLLKFWSLSASAGPRFNFGTAKTVGAITGPITSAGANKGTGTLDLNSAGQKPALVSGRFGLGTQLNFGPAKLYAEAGYSTPKVADVGLGLRIVW